MGRASSARATGAAAERHERNEISCGRREPGRPHGKRGHWQKQRGHRDEPQTIVLPRKRPARRQQQVHGRVRDEPALAIEQQSDAAREHVARRRTAACPASAGHPACPTVKSPRVERRLWHDRERREHCNHDEMLPAEPIPVGDATRRTRPNTRNEYLRWSHGIRPTAATTSATRRACEFVRRYA